MQLDDVGMCLLPVSGVDCINTLIVPSLTTGPRVEEAMRRSIRWLDRCIAQHASKGHSKQNLFAIIQGGLDSNLRDICLEEMIQRKDSVAGYAIGGMDAVSYLPPRG